MYNRSPCKKPILQVPGPGDGLDGVRAAREERQDGGLGGLPVPGNQSSKTIFEDFFHNHYVDFGKSKYQNLKI